MYEYIEKSAEGLSKKTKSIFNNSRLSLLKFDEINLPQAKKESDKLYDRLRKQSEIYFTNLLHYLSSKMVFNENEYNLNHFLTSFSPVLLYSFETESDRKRARHFEAIASIGNMKDPRILEEQKKEIRYWIMQVEELAVDVEREIFISETKKCGIKKVQWMTAMDEKVCEDCADLNEKIFDIDDIPRRPHVGCRCWLKEIR